GDDFHVFRLIGRFIEEVEYHHRDRVERKLMDNTDVEHTVGDGCLRRHISVISILWRVGHADHKGLPLERLTVDIQKIAFRFVRTDFAEYGFHIAYGSPDIVVGKSVADRRVKPDAGHIEKRKSIYRPAVYRHIFAPIQPPYCGPFIQRDSQI